MNKNFNTKNITEEIKDVPVNTTMGSVTKLLDLLFEVIDMNADLIALIREEAALKKHHRAYLHIREELEDCTDRTSARMQDILEETRGSVIGLMQDVHKTFRAREQSNGNKSRRKSKKRMSKREQKGGCRRAKGNTKQSPVPENF